MNTIYLIIQFDYYCEGETVLGAFSSYELADKWLESYKYNGNFHGDEGFRIRDVSFDEVYVNDVYKCTACGYTTEKGDDEHDCGEDSYLDVE